METVPDNEGGGTSSIYFASIFVSEPVASACSHVGACTRACTRAFRCACTRACAHAFTACPAHHGPYHRNFELWAKHHDFGIHRSNRKERGREQRLLCGDHIPDDLQQGHAVQFYRRRTQCGQPSGAHHGGTPAQYFSLRGVRGRNVL